MNDADNGRDELTFFSYYKTKKDGFMPDFYYQYENFRSLMDNIDSCLEGVESLNKYILFFEKCLSDESLFLQNFDSLYESICQVNLDILKRAFGETNLLRGHPFINENLSVISNSWKVIKAMFDKYKILPVKFPITRFNKCIDKLKEISCLERENYLEIKRIGKYALGNEVMQNETNA